MSTGSPAFMRPQFLSFDDSPAKPSADTPPPASLTAKMEKLALEEARDAYAASSLSAATPVTAHSRSMTLQTPSPLSEKPSTNFSTPEVDRPPLPLLPSRPGHTQSKERPKTIFDTPLASTPQPTIQLKQHASLAHTYKTPNQETHYLITQKRDTSCGATAFLMLYTSVMQCKRTPPKAMGTHLTNEFWSWYTTCDLAHYTEIIAHGNPVLKPHGLRLKERVLNGQDKENTLSFLIHQLTITKNPVLFSLSHAQVAGHWVVVDQFVDGHFYVRDPYTTKAYKVPLAEMQKHIEEKMEKCLYLEKLPVEGKKR